MKSAFMGSSPLARAWTQVAVGSASPKFMVGWHASVLSIGEGLPLMQSSSITPRGGSSVVE